MPIVPIIDSPTVNPEVGGAQPFAAPGVEPMKNFQPEQAQKLGAATQAAGQTAIKVGEMLQDQIDDANTKAADSWYTAQAQKLLFDPTTGYLNTIGIKAKDGYIPTQESLVKFKQDAEKALTNDVQRTMFASVVQKHELNFATQMDNHAVRQIRVYAAGESEAREKRYIDLAIADPENRQSNLNTALGEAKSRAQLLMLPADSEQAKAMTLNVYNSMHTGVASDMINKNDFIGAKAYIEKAYKDNQLESKTYLTLARQVDQGYKKQTATITGDKIYDAGKMPATTDPATIIDYVIDKNEGTTFVAKDGNAGASKFGITAKNNGLTDDQVKNLTYDQARNIYRKNYWEKIDADNLDPRIRAMAFDAAVNQGVGEAKRMIKESGGDPVKFAQLRRDLYNKIIENNPEKAKFKNGWMARVDRMEAMATGGTQSLSSMLAPVKEIADTELREMTEARIRDRWNRDETIRTQDYQEKVIKAQDIAFATEGGWVNIDPKLWADLKQEDKARMMNRPKNSDSNTLLMLQQNPSLWVPGKIEKFRPLLSESDYRQFVSKGGGEDGPSKVIAATIDAEQMKQQLVKAGLDKLLHPKAGSSEEKERIELNAKFEQMIDIEQRAKGNKPLTMDEKNALLVKLLKPVKVKAVYTSGPMSWIGKGETTDSKRVYQVQNRSNIIIPDDVRAEIIFDLNERGLPVTPDTILNGYLAKQEASK